ncbi:MAG: YHYH protein [Chitinophagales bacterium]|nr:YHYH protein [Chitinophagales bacterium]
MKKIITLMLVTISINSFAQFPPVITSWIINSNSDTGYGGIPSDVQQVQYSDSNVYVSCTDIPSYDIGPWPGNPNIAGNQSFVFKITRNPKKNLGNLVVTPYGHIGVWSNGVSIFNPKDAMSYANLNVWFQNAYYFEGDGFDDCLGHPNQQKEYHNHVNPQCLYDDTDSLNHSPIIGYAFDGFPVYGAYGYVNTDGTGGIKRMKSSYQFRNITQRTTLPDGTILDASLYGPSVNSTYPIGSYLQDYEYLESSGDLDNFNGRFCVTPDYPSGIYAYFVTIDDSLLPAYPYVLGPNYYGTVQSGNTGPGSGHNVISEPVTVYSSVNEADDQIEFSLYPNPVVDQLNVYIHSSYLNNLTAALYNPSGQLMDWKENLQPATTYSFDARSLSPGMYCLKIFSANNSFISKIIITK